MTRLTEREIGVELETMEGWALSDGAVQKRFSFDGFPEAVAFVASLVEDAEHANHHPDIRIAYRHVTVAWTTHDAGGVTTLDIAGARMTDRRARSAA